MRNDLNLAALIEANRKSDAVAMLRAGVHLVGATGERSARAALEATTRLYGGDLLGTVYFMNHRHTWLNGQTPLERAEESDDGLEFVLDMIGAIEAGVYI